jgi:hypothetical protein
LRRFAQVVSAGGTEATNFSADALQLLHGPATSYKREHRRARDQWPKHDNQIVDSHSHSEARIKLVDVVIGELNESRQRRTTYVAPRKVVHRYIGMREVDWTVVLGCKEAGPVPPWLAHSVEARNRRYQIPLRRAHLKSVHPLTAVSNRPPV